MTEWYGRKASCAHSKPRDDPIALGNRWWANHENPCPSAEQLSAWAVLGILTSKQIKQFFENKKLRKPVNRGGRPNKPPITEIDGRRVRQRALPVLAFAASAACFARFFALAASAAFGCLRRFAASLPCSCRSPSNLARAVCCAVQNLREWPRSQPDAPLRVSLTRLDRELGGALLHGLFRERSLQAHQTSKPLRRAAELLVPEAAA